MEVEAQVSEIRHARIIAAKKDTMAMAETVTRRAQSARARQANCLIGEAHGRRGTRAN